MENLVMNTQITLTAEENEPQADGRAASVEPVVGTKMNADSKGKLIPRKLETKVENGEGEEEREFAGRIAPINLNKTTRRKYHTQVLLISKKGMSRDCVLNDCEPGFERNVFNLLVAIMAVKRKVTLRTAERDGAGSGPVENEALK
jgi:hypothetical protein